MLSSLPDVETSAPLPNRDTLRVKVVEPMIRRIGPKIPLIGQDGRKGPFDRIGGHRELKTASPTQRVKAEYDEISQDLRASIIDYNEDGSIKRQRTFKGDPGFGYFTLRVTDFEGRKKNEVIHRVGLQYGPINRDKLHPNTEQELRDIEKIIESAL